MERWANKVAVVTGASAGIGLATAIAFVKNGLIVVALARRKELIEEKMKDIKGPGKVYPMKCDVGNRNEVTEVFDWINKNLGTVNILVNNAGVINYKSIEESQIEEMEQIIKVNVMGVLYCTKQAIPMMKKNNEDAHIVNVGSVLGHQVNGPKEFYSVYPATKFAVKALSQTLLNELLGTKIRVSEISPGTVETDMNAAERETMTYRGLGVDDLANAIIYVVSAPQHVVVSQLMIKPLGEEATGP